MQNFKYKKKKIYKTFPIVVSLKRTHQVAYLLLDNPIKTAFKYEKKYIHLY